MKWSRVFGRLELNKKYIYREVTTHNPQDSDLDLEDNLPIVESSIPKLHAVHHRLDYLRFRIEIEGI